MPYLLDASVLITANNSYYPIDRIPEYWGWLHMGASGNVKMPLEIFEEIKERPKDQEKDRLFAWIQDDGNKDALLLLEDVVVQTVQHVVSTGYASDLTDEEVEHIGRDPFLIAYALADPANRCVVTVEVRKPTKTRHKRQLPDVCETPAISRRAGVRPGRGSWRASRA
jgi:hypothetical protein